MYLAASSSINISGYTRDPGQTPYAPQCPSPEGLVFQEVPIFPDVRKQNADIFFGKTRMVGITIIKN